METIIASLIIWVVITAGCTLFCSYPDGFRKGLKEVLVLEVFAVVIIGVLAAIAWAFNTLLT